MNSFPTELIYVVAFAAVLLVQYLLKRFAPQEQYDDAAHDTRTSNCGASSSNTTRISAGRGFGRG